jgi:hypothetical protein
MERVQRTQYLKRYKYLRYRLPYYGPINQSNRCLPLILPSNKGKCVMQRELSAFVYLADSGESVSEPVEGLICGDQPQADLQLRRGQPIIQGRSWSCHLQTMRLIQLMIQAEVGSDTGLYDFTILQPALRIRIEIFQSGSKSFPPPQKSSVADPGYLSRIPSQKDSGSRISDPDPQQRI